eukprot:m.248100 g.248100  ORF g.248100 m.248100 type:complete len:469 (+) comp15624_c0_seq1:34-1440(+)
MSQDCLTQPTESQPVASREEPPAWGRLLPEARDQKPWELRENMYTIGRNRNCDLVLNLPVISNHHCKIFRVLQNSQVMAGDQQPQEMLVLVEDTSSNGTFVNGNAVGKGGRCVLQSGDRISFSSREKSSTAYIFYVRSSAGKESESLPYHLLKKLGSGAWGEVFLCVQKDSGERLAAKVISRKKLGGSTSKDRVLQEFEILRGLNHANVIGVRDLIELPQSLYIILEWARGGDLFDLIAAEKHLSEPDAKFLLYQLVNAVAYLHAHGVVHRDLKLENILLDRKGPRAVVKVTDFGLARLAGPASFMKTACGTPAYQAPEVLRTSLGGTGPGNKGYSAAVDIWSLGVVLFVCLGGYSPFADDSDPEDSRMAERILSGTYSLFGPYWRDVSADMRALVSKMLKVDPAERLALAEMRQLPIMQDPDIQGAIDAMIHTPVIRSASGEEMPPPPSRKRPFEDSSITTERANLT